MSILGSPKAVIFDLDDTLYSEHTYYQCGFRHAAKWLESIGFGQARSTLSLFLGLHLTDRRNVFDRAASHLKYTASVIPALIKAFYEAPLSLKAAADAILALDKLSGDFRLGLLTDGHAHVQERKLAALGIRHFFHSVLITDYYGRGFWKPNRAAFDLCCRMLSVSPAEAIFVGDNPERDIAGASMAGLRAVRIRRPNHYFSKTEHANAAAVADIADLSELLPLVGDGVA